MSPYTAVFYLRQANFWRHFAYTHNNADAHALADFCMKRVREVQS